MKVVEIFKSIDGEGIRAGLPVTFIRLGGCNLHCSYCDTKYAWEQGYKYTNMTPIEIVDKAQEIGCKRITLTGGEPLIHNDVDTLVCMLVDSGFEVNIETNGSVNISKFQYDNSIITMDYKCPSSGMQNRMLLSNLAKLRKIDVLKFVVGTEQDLFACEELSKHVIANVYVSPVFGNIEPKDIVDYILTHNMDNCRVQLQLHKFIWSPDKRGV